MTEQSPATRHSTPGGTAPPEVSPRKATLIPLARVSRAQRTSFEDLMSVAGTASVRLPG